MKRLLATILFLSGSILSFGFEDEPIISASSAVDFSILHSRRVDSIKVLSVSDEWNKFSRIEIISNLVDIAISSEKQGKENVVRSALNLLSYQPAREDGARLMEFSMSNTNLSNRIAWTTVPFSMMGAYFLPYIKAHFNDGSWSLEERLAIYRTGMELLRSNGYFLLTPKQSKEDRIRIGEALRDVLPFETDDKAFRELNWMLHENLYGRAFSEEEFALLKQRAAEYRGEGENPYEKTLQTLHQQIAEGNTNIVIWADVPPRPLKRKIRMIH